MKNRNTILHLAILALMCMPLRQISAQHVELSPFVGYETGAHISTNIGELHVADGLDFGGVLNVGIGGGRYGEFSYSHVASKLSLNGPTSYSPVDLAVDYYSLGMMQEIRPDEKATPYGLFTLGIVNYRPTSGDFSSENKMHVSIAGGVKIRTSDRIAVRLQARLLMPLYYAGTYFSVGTGGAGYGISGGIHGVQGDFTAALVIKIK